LKLLIIQTAFLGDVVLATSLLETLHAEFPEAELHILVRSGNEGLFRQHPYLKKVFVWDKSAPKWKTIYSLIKQIRREKYDETIVVQRYFTAGLLAVFSGATAVSGFRSSPFSRWFTHRAKHVISASPNSSTRDGTQSCVNCPSYASTTSSAQALSRSTGMGKIGPYTMAPFVTLSPASVWFTKQWPASEWVKLMQQLPAHFTVYLLGGKNDKARCESIRKAAARGNAMTLAGDLDLLASAALMSKAYMNFTNDSGPLHLCSAMNAPVSAFFLSTVPEFGFGPLSEKGKVIQTTAALPCRPCGLHGHRTCPKGHFSCSQLEISVSDWLKS
jgi:heptosyltransferase-2